MVLKVEDGTGGDALISLAGFKTYSDSKGYDYSSYTDEEIEQAIRRGSTYISKGFNFQGEPYGLRVQIQAWPRTGVVVMPEGYAVDYTTIPREVNDATAEASFYELGNPNGLNPTVTLADRVISESVGPISVTYARRSAGEDLNTSRPVIMILNDILRPLLAWQGTSAVTARADRG